MRKLIFLLTLLLCGSFAMSQKWDRQMKVTSMNIRIDAGVFTATTWIEMEFCNPSIEELEGLYQFHLEPGQVITAFQLDLNGKYRNGSIEEKWKATNAYNSIVGKRIDPALLTMDSPNSYNLRIYPVHAKGCRKITMTIQQFMKWSGNTSRYYLPLSIQDTIRNLSTIIRVNGQELKPFAERGLIEGEKFLTTGSESSLEFNRNFIPANKAIQFAIPVDMSRPRICTKTVNGKTYFVARLQKQITGDYQINPKKLSIYWDQSASGVWRSRETEINFLKNYVLEKRIEELDIIYFNQELQENLLYKSAYQDTSWCKYLRNLKYEGAKQFGVLNFAKASGDVIFLFSNGRNSYGKDLPIPGHKPVYAVGSAYNSDFEHLKKIAKGTGGQVINLYSTGIPSAIDLASRAQNILFAITSTQGTVKDFRVMVDSKEANMLVSGVSDFMPSDLTFYFGNSGALERKENLVVGGNPKDQCESSVLERGIMLTEFLEQFGKSDWRATLEFGQREKVVTLYTAYIVLERIQDYITYQITPPAELESECDMNYFVSAEEKKRKQFNVQDEFNILSNVVNTYNVKLRLWDKNAVPINLKKALDLPVSTSSPTSTIQPAATTTKPSNAVSQTNTVVDNTIPANVVVLTGTEVVVTAMGQTRSEKELGYSTVKVRSAELIQAKAVTVDQGLNGKVSGLNVQTVNNGVFADTRITLRGIRSLTGNNQPLLVLDNMPLPLSYIKQINVNDILTVEVLKNNAAAALYGSDGVNGAILITTKRGRRYGGYIQNRGLYILSQCDDVDYLQEIKEAPQSEKLKVYERLKLDYRYSKGFFIDMAEHLYAEGFRNEALNIIFSTADESTGDRRILKAVGYTLEAMKEFDKAIGVYEALLELDQYDVNAYRDLALAHYQAGNYQQAVDILYRGITTGSLIEIFRLVGKSMMLQEMNAIISVHRDKLDLSHINQSLIKPLPVDLRITVDCNMGDLSNKVSIAEPGATVCSYNNPVTKNGGFLAMDSSIRYINYSADEYQIKYARPGLYRVRIDYKDTWYNYGSVPVMIKMMVFRNFGKENQTITVQNAILDNQFGLVQIGEFVWDGPPKKRPL